MNRDDLLSRLATGLQDCRTANNVGLSEHFTLDEIKDFANTLVFYLPESYNLQMLNLEEEVFDLLVSKQDLTNGVLLRYIKEIYSKLLTNDTEMLSAMVHSITLMLRKIYDEHRIEPEQVINDGFNYYKSLLLSSDDLAKNVHEMPALGAVAEFDNAGYYIRVDYDALEFVPTLTTKNNFQYLTPKKWKT